jgi:hypothetical protein
MRARGFTEPEVRRLLVGNHVRPFGEARQARAPVPPLRHENIMEQDRVPGRYDVAMQHGGPNVPAETE